MMRFAEQSSIRPLLDLWRPQEADPSQRAQCMRSEAERCFRLAQGIASFKLAEELEEIGRALLHEAIELENVSGRLARRLRLVPDLAAAE